MCTDVPFSTISMDLKGFGNFLKILKNVHFQNVGCFEKLMTSTLQKNNMRQKYMGELKTAQANISPPPTANSLSSWI